MHHQLTRRRCASTITGEPMNSSITLVISGSRALECGHAFRTAARRSIFLQ
jgi:hypothetical protein